MRQALLFGPRDLRVVDAAKPEPGPDEAVVRVMRTAPYGTDIELYKAENERHRLPYPAGIGADFSGIVDSVGGKVFGFTEGDRVSALAGLHCGRCRFCRDGRTNLCVSVVNPNEGRQESCQEYAVVKANKLAELPAPVTFDAGAMLASLVTGLNLLERIKPQPGDNILIVGTGAMAWGCIALASTLGVRVVAVGAGQRRAALARDLGANRVVEMSRLSEDVSGRLEALLPDGADCVIETTTSDWGVETAFAAAGMGARVGLLGGATFPLSGWDLVGREISVAAVRGGHHQDQALRMLEQGAIDLRPTITNHMSLEEAPARV